MLVCWLVRGWVGGFGMMVATACLSCLQAVGEICFRSCCVGT
jgi:hypothetical protein